MKVHFFFLLLFTSALFPAWMEELNIENAGTVQRVAVPENSQASPKSQDAEENLKYTVTLIEAVRLKDKDAVEITWMDVDDVSVSYNIYRHTEAISTAEICSAGKMLGTIKAGIQKFTDIPDQEGNFYYAVTVLSRGTEYKNLIYEQSYTSAPVRFMQETKKLSMVRNLKGVFNKWLSAVYLRWDPPETGAENYKYFVYRHTALIDAEKTVRNLKPVEILEMGNEKYRDTSFEAIDQDYYYCVLIKTAKNMDPDMAFEKDQNFTAAPVHVEKKGNLTVYSDQEIPVLKDMSLDTDDTAAPLSTNTETSAVLSESPAPLKKIIPYAENLRMSGLYACSGIFPKM